MSFHVRTKPLVLAVLCGLVALPAWSQTGAEPPFFQEKLAKKELPPLAERLPQTPIVVDRAGQYGGDIVTLVSRARDIRYISTYAYTRLVGYDRNLDLQPDLLEKFENEDDRVFTFTLRAGHRWSDGSPFTAEDFRYYWEDVAQNKDLSPAGPPVFMLSGGQPPRFVVIDERTVRFSWD